jgi:hypothetical protein
MIIDDYKWQQASGGLSCVVDPFYWRSVLASSKSAPTTAGRLCVVRSHLVVMRAAGLVTAGAHCASLEALSALRWGRPDHAPAEHFIA